MASALQAMMLPPTGESMTPGRLVGPDGRDWPAVPVSRALLRNALLLAEALFSTESGPPPAERLEWLRRELADYLGRAGLFARLLLRFCFALLTVCAPLADGRLRQFASLSLEGRCRAIERFEQTPLAPAFLACKALLCIVYFEHPDAAREIGADGACLKVTP